MQMLMCANAVLQLQRAQEMETQRQTVRQRDRQKVSQTFRQSRYRREVHANTWHFGKYLEIGLNSSYAKATAAVGDAENFLLMALKPEYKFNFKSFDF